VDLDPVEQPVDQLLVQLVILLQQVQLKVHLVVTDHVFQMLLVQEVVAVLLTQDQMVLEVQGMLMADLAATEKHQQSQDHLSLEVAEVEAEQAFKDLVKVEEALAQVAAVQAAEAQQQLILAVAEEEEILQVAAAVAADLAL
jgi:hypothetical protein